MNFGVFFGVVGCSHSADCLSPQAVVPVFGPLSRLSFCNKKTFVSAFYNCLVNQDFI